VKIAMLGTRGVPAQYGGFETAVDEIGRRLVQAGHEVIVYCRNPGQRQRDHLGMRLVNLPAVRRKSLETLSHTSLSAVHAIVRARPDAALVFNPANAPFVPLLRAARVPTAVHLDGLEWKRAKWAGAGARYFLWAERAAVRWGDEVIADSRQIADHVKAEYGRDCVLIAYGAPVVHPGSARLATLGLEPRGYHLVVARFAPENHLREIVTGFRATPAAQPLVVVGDAPYEDAYGDEVRAAADSDPRVRFIGSIYDQPLLDEIYGNALSYLHGHSVGGTNPSLLQAMGAGAPVSAFDVVFNREVTDGFARYWTTPAELGASVLADEADVPSAQERGEKGRSHAEQTYRWEEVAAAYEALCKSLVERA
jgi:glycosyltransferase involved in cell wall biosynthesis